MATPVHYCAVFDLDAQQFEVTLHDQPNFFMEPDAFAQLVNDLRGAVRGVGGVNNTQNEINLSFEMPGGTLRMKLSSAALAKMTEYFELVLEGYNQHYRQT